MRILVFLIVVMVVFPAMGQVPGRPSLNKTKVRPTMTEGLRVEGSVVFTYVDEKKRRRLSADIYSPAEGNGPFPAIVMYFGGGWQNGRPALFAPLAQRLAQLGYVTVVPEYRLSGEAPFPAAVHDAKAAVRFTRKSARRFKVDPDRIACMGGSAGGHLAGFVGASNGVERFEGAGEHREVSSEVQAAIVMCGPMDLFDPVILARVEKAVGNPNGDAILDFMGGEPPSKNKAIYREASPIFYVSAATPPMLFIDGENDRPEIRYVDFRKKLDSFGKAHDFVLMPQGPHPFWVYEEWFEPTVQAVDAFLKKNM